MGVLRDLRALLRLPDFRRLLVVRLLSQLSDGVFQVALAAYVVFSPENQASPGAVASALAILLLPYSLLGPFTGVLLDRWRRRQVLLYCNVLRAVMCCATAVLVLLHVPTWLFYLSALSVTAVNRFVLAGLSAALPRVVDEKWLVTANSLSPTAGTLVATLGGGAAFLVHLFLPAGAGSNAATVLLGAALYLCAGLSALDPRPRAARPRRAARAHPAGRRTGGHRPGAGRRAAAPAGAARRSQGAVGDGRDALQLRRPDRHPADALPLHLVRSVGRRRRSRPAGAGAGGVGRRASSSPP